MPGWPEQPRTGAHMARHWQAGDFQWPFTLMGTDWQCLHHGILGSTFHWLAYGRVRSELQHNQDLLNKQKGTAISISNKSTGFILFSSAEKALIPTVLGPIVDFQYSPEAIMSIVTFTKDYSQSTSAQKRQGLCFSSSWILKISTL